MEGDGYFLFIFFLDVMHGLRDLSSLRPRIKPEPPAMVTWSPNHWMAREVPGDGFLNHLEEGPNKTGVCNYVQNNQLGKEELRQLLYAPGVLLRESSTFPTHTLHNEWTKHPLKGIKVGRE